MTKNDERSYLEDFLSVPENWLVYEQERLAGDFADFIRAALASQNVPQCVIAERLKKSPAVISRSLNKGSNMTLQTLIELAASLGYQLAGFKLEPIPVVVAEWWSQPKKCDVEVPLAEPFGSVGMSTAGEQADRVDPRRAETQLAA